MFTLGGKMNSNNSIYITCLIAFSLLGFALFYSFYLQNNIASIEKIRVHQEKKSESEIDDLLDYEYVSEFDSVEEAIAATGYSPIKEYQYYESTYFFVPEKVEHNGDTYDYVLYRYKADEKKLYRNYRGGISVRQGVFEGEWYNNEFARLLIYSYYKLNHNNYYIAGGDQYADVFYGAWFGDEVKNISFGSGKFEYSLIGEYEGINIYFWTYELKDSQKLLSTVIIREGGQGADAKESFRCKDVEKLLGIRCKYRMDYRVVIYLMLICAFLVMTSVLVSKAYVMNNNLGDITGKTILLWLISGVLCIWVVLLISYFMYNPHLIFGGGINELFYNLTGHDLPNPPDIEI